jgi:2,4-dienoyl-CoA reductase (NADPH2)
VLVPSVPHFDKSDMFEALTRAEIASFVGGASQPVYQVMTQQDIDWLVGQFAAAAALAVRAGFDCVEIHAGHGYVLSSFLSPHYNRVMRTEAVRTTRAVAGRGLRAVRAAVGRLPILCRIDATEFRVARHHARMRVTARPAVRAGCDAIDVARTPTPPAIAFTEAPITAGAYLGFAGDLPRHGRSVIAVGRRADVAEGMAQGASTW